MNVTSYLIQIFRGYNRQTKIKFGIKGRFRFDALLKYLAQGWKFLLFTINDKVEGPEMATHSQYFLLRGSKSHILRTYGYTYLQQFQEVYFENLCGGHFVNWNLQIYEKP